MKNRKGFTLIELLAVIVILAIVMVVTIPSVLNSMSSAKSSQLDNASKGLSDWLTKQYNISSFGDDMLKVDQVYTSFTEAYGEYEETYDSAKALSSCEIESNEMLSAAGISEPEVNIDLENSYVWKNDNKIEVKLTAKENGSFYVNGGTNISYSNSDTSSYSEFKIYGNSIQNGTPSPSNPVEIKSVGDKSKNLFDIKLFNQNKVDGKRKDNNGNIVNDSVSNYSDYYISVKSNTQYTLYLIGLQGYYEYDENKNLTGRTVFGSVNTKTFTTSSTTKFIQIQYLKNNLDTTNAQLEKGSTATSYEPYYEGYRIPITVSDGANSSTTNIYLDEPLRKIGDYADYIDFKNGKVVRNVGKYIVTGNESIVKFSSSTSYYLNSVLPGAKYADNIQMLSNYYVGRTSGGGSSYSDGNVWLQSTSSYPRCYFGTSYSSLTDFTTFLQNLYNIGNPVEVVYPLNAPTEQTISLPNITSLNEKTTCSVGTEVQPSKIVVEY